MEAKKKDENPIRDFLFGTPKKAVTTVSIIFIFMVIFLDPVRDMVVQKLHGAISLFAGPLLCIGLVILGLRWMLGMKKG